MLDFIARNDANQEVLLGSLDHVEYRCLEPLWHKVKADYNIVMSFVFDTNLSKEECKIILRESLSLHAELNSMYKNKSSGAGFDTNSIHAKLIEIMNAVQMFDGLTCVAD